MQIEDMTVEQIERYLQERKTRKPKLGGLLKQAGALKRGEICWIEMKVFAQNMSSVALDSPTQPGFQMEIHPSRLVETNVPEQRRARRRMTAGEAAEQLQVGDRVWVSASVRHINKGEYYAINVEFECSETLWCEPKQQIEVEA